MYGTNNALFSGPNYSGCGFNLANKGWTVNKAGNNADTNISDIVESVCVSV